MISAKRQHESHKVWISLYLNDELRSDEKILFMKKVARCKKCQEELRCFEDIRRTMTGAAKTTVAPSVYKPAVETLHRMHREDVFQHRLLHVNDAGQPSNAGFPFMRFALYGLLLLLVLTLPFLLIPDQWLPSKQIVRQSRVPDAVPSSEAAEEQAGIKEPIVRHVDQLKTDKFHPPVMDVTTPKSLKETIDIARMKPVPSPMEEQGILMDSATVVLLINYLSGNISNGRRLEVDLNCNGVTDAVDLAVLLNFNVDNITNEQLSRILEDKERRIRTKSVI